ncbi:MAG: crossover junction endodeoxyribonuclease RuvC [Alphaproteobacteria bacterium]|nr:crossover junction endodeoxyribonuclease RuvC [Alphaproteobacteria bacterium]
MRIIGIDPGLNHTGFAILERSHLNVITHIKSGVIRAAARPHISLRLYRIFSELNLVIDEYKPNLAAIEEIFVNSNSKTSLSLGFARGSILASIGKHEIRTIDLAPNKIKKSIVGYGKADKDQVQKMLKFVIPNVNFTSSDEADAIAIAYTGLVLF